MQKVFEKCDHFCRYLRMSLAVADLLAGIVTCGILSSHYNHFCTVEQTLNHSQVFINVFGAGYTLSMAASILLLVFISIDR